MKYYVFTLALAVCFMPGVSRAEALDTDGDGLTDEQEKVYYTDPTNPDTDGDSFGDGLEIASRYSPHAKDKKLYQMDYDRDGLNDLLEIAFETDLGHPDTDRDGYSDFDEVMYAYNPVEDNPTARLSRRIEVDLSTQRLLYVVDEKLVKAFPVSTGNPWTPTPSGTYEITRLIPIARYVGSDYDLPNVKWNMQFKDGGYFIHGAYWHNDFGKRTHSHGCVNMRTKDAGYLYRYIEPGVQVVVTGTTPKRRTVGT